MRKFFIVLLLNFYTIFFSQNSKLEGKWILDKQTELNGNLLPINDFDFSQYEDYKFVGNKLFIGGMEMPITVTGNKIKTPGSDFEYLFKDKYLILKNVSSKRMYWLLNPNSFIELYPEFRPNEVSIDDKVYFVQNEVFSADFSYKGGFSSFWIDFFSDNNLTKKKTKFIVQFIVTKDSKIEKVKILESSDPKLEVSLKNYIKKGEKFFDNRTGKDILYSVSQVINFQTDDDNYRGSDQESNSQEFRKFIKEKKRGDDSYLTNDFKNAINFYEKIKLSQSYSFHTSDIYLKLGISYLATGKNDLACVNFNKAGGLTNFKIRNYLLHFCGGK